MADSPLTPWKDRPWVLVSSSPTRLKVLREQGIDATVVHPLTEEMTLPYHAIEQSLVELAKAKLLNADITDEQIGLACDTLVLCGDTVLGKPGNVEEARHMLQIQHEVGRQEILTGVALRVGGKTLTGLARATVTLHKESLIGLDEHLASGGWEGIAGGYDYQRDDDRYELTEGTLEDIWGLPVGIIAQLLNSAEQQRG